VQSEQASDSSDETVAEANSCQLCDCLVHKQSKQLLIVYAALLVIAVPDPVTFQPHNSASDYKFTLQGFINKGPPVLYC